MIINEVSAIILPDQHLSLENEVILETLPWSTCHLRIIYSSIEKFFFLVEITH